MSLSEQIPPLPPVPPVDVAELRRRMLLARDLINAFDLTGADEATKTFFLRLKQTLNGDAIEMEDGEVMYFQRGQGAVLRALACIELGEQCEEFILDSYGSARVRCLRSPNESGECPNASRHLGIEGGEQA